MGRNILFITTDQQRYDALGCNGGTIARTPVVDGLADDPHQWHNLWDDPARRSLRDDLIADLYGGLPAEVRHLDVVAPV